jgi:exonuclease SbcD
LSELTVKEVFEKSLQGNADIDEEESVILTNLFNHCLIEMEESQEQQV